MKIFLMFGLLFLGSATIAFAQESYLFPITERGKTGYIDGSGKVVIKPQFDDGWSFREGLAPVRIGGDWGYIDTSGRMAIKPQFYQASGFVDGIASVGVYHKERKIVKGTVGYKNYIDKSGKLLNEQMYGVGFSFSNGFARILTEDSKHGYVDRSGKEIFFWKDPFVEGFNDERALFKTNGNMDNSLIGYLDKAGKIAIPAEYWYGSDFAEGLACVSSAKNQAGFIDINDKTIIDFKFEDCDSFSEGLAAVKVDGKWGYIDKTGKMIINPKYDEASGFSDGVAIVLVRNNTDAGETRTWVPGTITADKNGAFGVIDRDGKLIIPAKFVQIGSFYKGLAWVNLSGSYLVHGETDRWGYINKAGGIIWKSFQ